MSRRRTIPCNCPPAPKSSWNQSGRCAATVAGGVSAHQAGSRSNWFWTMPSVTMARRRSTNSTPIFAPPQGRNLSELSCQPKCSNHCIAQASANAFPFGALLAKSCMPESPIAWSTPVDRRSDAVGSSGGHGHPWSQRTPSTSRIESWLARDAATTARCAPATVASRGGNSVSAASRRADHATSALRRRSLRKLTARCAACGRPATARKGARDSPGRRGW